MRRLMVFVLLLSVIVLAPTAPALAAAGDRVALVIGNAHYEHAGTLKNPQNDARDMAAALNRLGFTVIDGYDLDQSAMRTKIREFSMAIEGAAVALFYYAGHGLQVDGNNHLAPVNAKLQKEGDLDFETLPLNLVLRQMERERRTNLVFLDACRDNPLARQLARSIKTRSTSVASGLAKVESGIGMLIAYATSPGNVALDGQGRNSPYTSALLNHIETPSQDIGSLMIAVRQEVLAASDGKQVPWEHSSLTGQFYFKPAPAKVAAATPAPEPAASPSTGIESQKLVAAAYQATAQIGSCGAYRVFEEQHRGSFYGRLAEEYLARRCGGEARAIAVEEPAPAKTPAGPTLASADPGNVPGAHGPKQGEPQGEALAFALQKHLERVGCDPGPIDGDWGDRSRQALERFKTHAKIDIPTEDASSEALAALEARTDRICPVVARVEPQRPTVVRQAPKVREKRHVEEPRAVRREADRFRGGEDTRVRCQKGFITNDCFPVR